MTTQNEQARTEINSEMEKLGIKPEIDTNPKPIEKQDEAPEPKEEKPEAKEPESDKKPEGDKKPEDPRPKKYIPLAQHNAEKLANKMKFEEMQATIDELKKGTSTKEEVNTDVKAFAESLGVEDPEVLEKIVTFVSTGTKKTMDELREKIDKLTTIKTEADAKDQIKAAEEKFTSEWDSFVKSDDFTEAFPNATAEQKKEARELMDEKAHSEEWSKYDLNYIFFKNRTDFNDSLGTKTFKGSGQTQTQGITVQKTNTGAPKLSADPSAKEIKEYEDYMGKVLNKGNLAEKPNETL